MHLGRHLQAVLLVLGAFFLGLGCGADLASVEGSPGAAEGSLNLAGWDFEEDGAVLLDGEWEFYWAQLLEPADFAREPSPSRTGFLPVPSTWSRYELEGEELPGQGYATLRLTVDVEPSSGLRSLTVGEVSSAYRLWVNSALLASGGTVGKNRDEETPSASEETFSFPVDGDTIELLIQVSNFHHARGGIWGKLELGTDAQIRAVRNRVIQRQWLLFGSLLMIGLYHFGLYALRRKEVEPLYFGIFCLAVALRAAVALDKTLVSQYVPWELSLKTEYVTFFVSAQAGLMFFRSMYPHEFSRVFVRVLQIAWSLLVLLVLVTPARIYSHTTVIFYPLLVLTVGYAIYALVLAASRKREAAGLLSAGFLVLFVAIINDMLNQSRIISSGYWTPEGFLFLIFSQSYVLSARFARSLTLSEELSENLEKKVQERTNELSLAKQQLERGNDLIRRYVPSQLAEQILSGDYEERDRPERRKLSIFFSDVEGFTEAADQLEPEALSALLNEYLSEMAEIAEKHGTTINQFVGDGIMILFGAHETTNDREQALRAVRMALAMQARMGELQRKWFEEGIQAPFRIRIGINTGMASVGNYGSAGRLTYSAIGNQTNLAARIQSDCEPGKVLVSHSTWALVKDEIACVDKGESEVKGLHYPVRVYEVAEEASHGSGDA
jgi:class 3 adenylate cyclase